MGKGGPQQAQSTATLSEDAGNLGLDGAGIASSTYQVGVDGTVANALSPSLPVHSLNKFSVQLIGTTIHATTVIEIKRSVDRVNFHSFGSAIQLTAAAPVLWEQDLDGAAFLIAEVTTEHSSNEGLEIIFYPYREWL